MKDLANAFLTLIVGVAIGVVYMRMNPTVNQTTVRQALYESCAKSDNFYPTEKLQGNVCNRHTINLSLASIYGGSFVPPLPDPDTIRAYEQPLIDIRNGK